MQRPFEPLYWSLEWQAIHNVKTTSSLELACAVYILKASYTNNQKEMTYYKNSARFLLFTANISNTSKKDSLWARHMPSPSVQAQKQKFQSHTPGIRTKCAGGICCLCFSEPEKLILFSMSVSVSLLLTAQRCILGSSPTPWKDCLFNERHKVALCQTGMEGTRVIYSG